jgi:hypothetical protein
MDELADGGFALGGALLAVKVFGDNDFSGEERPGFWNFDVFLFKNNFTGVVGDFGCATLPFDLVEGVNFRIAEDAIEFE